MNGLRSMRWLALTGPLFAIIFIIVAFFVQGETPGEQASAQTVMDYYNDHQTETLTGVFLAPLASALLVLFFSHLRSLARERRISTGAGPTVMISGAVLWASGLLLGSVLELALVSASDNDQAQIAETANVLGNVSWVPFITGIAITLIGAGMTVLSSDFLPRWLGWTAAVAGVVSLAGPGGFLGFFVGPLWILVAGILLARPATVPMRDPHRVERRTHQEA